MEIKRLGLVGVKTGLELGIIFGGGGIKGVAWKKCPTDL